MNLGVWDRFGDAVYPYIGIEAASWLLGLSYDVPTSNVSNSFRNLQSFEISFTCLFGVKKSGPACLTAPDPKSGTSANFATSARGAKIGDL
jgi:hypothetical protein